MIGILSNSNDPAFNLATEEYLLRQTEHDAFFLYINKPSIIVGKHQNALAEINFEFTREHNIPVFRRLSGGGTVYHDLNNLNFCFIRSGKKGQLVNFSLYSKPILKALENLGIKAHFGKRHDIQIDNKKISGNASHVYKNRVMHHGTLLFNSQLDVLNNALKTNPLNFKDKAVKSVRSEVTNIINYTNNIDFNQFTHYIFNYLLNYFDDSQSSALDMAAIEQINGLVKDKFTTNEWNYGYSPNYSFKKRIKTTNSDRINVALNVSKGRISECQITSNNKVLNEVLNLVSKELIGVKHELVDLNNYFDQNKEVQNTRILKSEWNELLF